MKRTLRLPALFIFGCLTTFTAHAAETEKARKDKDSANIDQATKMATYRGAYFEIQYPAGFNARPIGAMNANESDAAAFTAPAGTMQFYVFSPQWGGDAPGIGLDTAKETQIARKTAQGKSSGVAGRFTWTTIVAKDKRYTRTYQDFLSADNSIHWVIGMKYESDAALRQYRDSYLAFKASLKQLAD